MEPGHPMPEVFVVARDRVEELYMDRRPRSHPATVAVEASSLSLVPEAVPAMPEHRERQEPGLGVAAVHQDAGDILQRGEANLTAITDDMTVTPVVPVPGFRQKLRQGPAAARGRRRVCLARPQTRLDMKMTKPRRRITKNEPERHVKKHARGP